MLKQVELLPASASSSEIYLLSRHSPDNVKLRSGRVEVKQLLCTSATGLELWRPCLKAPFPLDADVVSDLCDAWRCEHPARVPLLGTAEMLLNWVARTLPMVQPLPIRKLRRRFRIATCAGEWATVESNGVRRESLSLEHSDLAVVLAAMDALDLTGEPNTNYVTGLKQFLGWSLDESLRATGSPA